jgi:hypothetical protein
MSNIETMDLVSSILLVTSIALPVSDQDEREPLDFYVIVAKNEKLILYPRQQNSEPIQLSSQERPHLLPLLNTNLTRRNSELDVVDSGDMQ